MSRSAGWETPTRLLKSCPSLRLMKPVTSQARNCTWMAAWPKFKPCKCADLAVSKRQGSGGAAARLGLKRTTLIAKMKKLGISRPVREDDITPLSENRKSEHWLQPTAE